MDKKHLGKKFLIHRRLAEVRFTRVRKKENHRLILEVKSFINGVNVGLSRTVADPPDHDKIQEWFEQEETRLGADIDYFLTNNGIERENKEKPEDG